MGDISVGKNIKEDKFDEKTEKEDKFDVEIAF